MSVPVDIVNQSVFTAALFLTLISVPKISVLAIWYSYRYLISRHQDKVVEKYVLGSLLKNETLSKAVREAANNPLKRVNVSLKEIEHFTKEIRDPIIEAAVALALMWFVYPIFPQISIWLNISIIIIIMVIACAFLLIILVIKDLNKMNLPKDDEPADYTI